MSGKHVETTLKIHCICYLFQRHNYNIFSTLDFHIVSTSQCNTVSTANSHIVSTSYFFIGLTSGFYVVSTLYLHIVPTSDCHIVSTSYLHIISTSYCHIVSRLCFYVLPHCFKVMFLHCPNVRLPHFFFFFNKKKLNHPLHLFSLNFLLPAGHTTCEHTSTFNFINNIFGTNWIRSVYIFQSIMSLSPERLRHATPH